MIHKSLSPLKSVARHLILLVVGVLILTGVYLYFRNPTPVTLTAIGLALAHLAAVGGVFLLGRKLLPSVFRRMHGAPEHTHGGGAHSHTPVGTDGGVIHWAAQYDVGVALFYGGKKKLHQYQESIIRLARLQPGEKVLDVGCGPGQMAITARRLVPQADLYGIDASPEMIARAQQNAAAAGVNVDFRLGLVEALDFPDNSLDVVLSNFMVHHLPDPLKVKAFAEIYRVLKPGGRLQITEFEPPQKGVMKWILNLVVGGMMHIDTGQIPSLLEQAGFTDVVLKGSGHSLATLITGRK